MKQFKHKGIIGAAILAMAILALICQPAAPARADSQGLPSTISTATNLPSIVYPGASNQTSVVTLRQPRGLGASLTVTLATNAVETLTVWIYPSVDATNFATTPWIWTLAGNGTTNMTWVTNWSRVSLEGYQALNFGILSNGAPSTILTNKGLILNIPNQ